MKLVAEKISDACDKYSNLPALKVKGEILSYKQLYQSAAQLANCIKSKTIYSKNIGILSNRSKTTYIGTLACLFAGYSFVPLNKNFPAERLTNMIQSAELEILIVDNSSIALLQEIPKKIAKNLIFIFPEDLSSADFPCKEIITVKDISSFSKIISKPEVSAKDIVYILFTSGSTGLPKGVPITQENLVSFIETNQRFYNINTSDRLSQTFEHTFDLSIFDMMMSWCHGACLYAMQPIDLLSPSYFVKENQITVWFSVPSLISLARKKNILKPNSMPSLRLSLFCGEALSIQNVNAWRMAAPQSVIENLYGPTELTIACSRFRLENDFSVNETFNDIIPLGKVYDIHQVKILDENDKESIEGELCISGKQMFQGYWKNDRKSKAAFVTLDKEQYYRTGDKVKISETGNLLYIGRKDYQVKINGYRVELGDIECCIKKFPNIIEAIAVGFPEENGNFSSVAVFVTTVSPILEDEAIKFTRQKLPTYMIPKLIKSIDTMPLNNNGKIDRNQLYLLLNQ